MTDLTGKAAIITGASRGIGAAAARELATQGASVVLAARSHGEINAIAEEIRDQGGRAESVVCDVSHYRDLAKVIETCQRDFGSVDILVNNAGVIDPIARLADSDPDHWDKVVDINLKGVYHGLRAAIPVMQEQGSGVIVNISSGAATGALEGWSHYCATKAAVFSLTRCADKEYRNHGIRVVGLSPGTVATDMQISIKSSGINPVSQLDPSVHIPADWPARAIAWLCTEDAAEFAGTDFSIKNDEGRRRVGLID
ncbi:SDR family NAD(P)-dependent oxidoreductase [Pelagibius sp. Alg239-R121]|uniref:SDR family NAD(P)-dependent oxidoreductase n=1 Tax=Pelagibius sp. Alg239-R121 TaxID=2993448 RepID=UPI0024A6236A|nr:SDR family oxidoreductase [Pelagibius sp. Alg239-R121]